MKKIYYLVPVLMLAVLVTQTTAAQQMTITPGIQWHTTGAIHLVFDDMSVTHNGGGDWSAATVVLKGNNNEVRLDGTGNWHVRRLVIDKSAGMAKLGSPLLAGERVQLQKGLLDLHGQELTLAPTATVEGEIADNRIIGPDGGAVLITVPLNAPVSKHPGNLGAVISSTANLGNVTIRRSHAPQTDATHGKTVLRYYQLTAQNNSNLHATLRLHYLEPELNTLDENLLEQFYRSAAGSHWLRTGALVNRNTSLDYIENTGLASLAPYYALSTAVALPLQWGSFKAICNNGNVAIQWTTKQESNTSHFVIQRSIEGSSWIMAGNVIAKENSTETVNYHYTDVDPFAANRLFYRIVAVDKDGKENFSKVISIQNCTTLFTMKLTPVPAHDHTTLQITTVTGWRSAVQLFGSDGRLYRQQVIDIKPGVNQYSIDVSGLSNGAYHIKVMMADGRPQIIPFIKQ